MLKKLIFGGIVYLGLLGVSSCFCDPVQPYIDFENLILYAQNPDLKYGDSLFINLEPEAPIFLSQQIVDAVSPNKTFALSCPHDGENGMKYKIVDFNIVSLHDFDSTHLAGTSLNDVFYSGSVSNSILLSDTTFKPQERFPFTYGMESIYLPVSPKIDSSHIFQITIQKANGTTITSQTQLITWTR